MSSSDLTNRNTCWVSEARKVGDSGETNLNKGLMSVLPDHFSIIQKPRDLSKIYGEFGIVPDLCIINNLNGKRIYIEKKTGNNGGNAHERAYKYLSVPLKQEVRKIFNTPEEPFYFVFSGDTFKNQKYISEIGLLLAHIPQNYILWDGSLEQIRDFSHNITKALAN